MVASTLGIGEPEDSHDHSEHEAGDAADDGPEMHPWAKEMYRQGLSFNGNERSKLFLGGGDGSFEDMSDLCGADSPLDGRGLLTVDFDDDGDLDLFVHNLQRERHSLYRNETAGQGFLKVRLRATSSQYEAIGALVIVDGPRGAVAQLMSRGSGFASCQSPELIFGLGASEQAEVRVIWPGGSEESFGSLAGTRTVSLVEGSGSASTLAASAFELHDPLPQGLKRDLGEVLPSVRLETSDGKAVNLNWEGLAAGRSLYLNLWASYCRPCVQEVPDLERIHGEAERTVVSISVDVPDARADARGILDAAGATYPVYFISMEGEEGPDHGIDGMLDLLRLPIPTTLIIGPDGRLRDVVRGPIDPAAVGHGD
ncbi:MAG: thiol-disulfide isomerase/thioredoxin [Chlamydiales bacterium]